MAEQVFYVGMDIDDAYCITSYYTSGVKEPETFSMVTGSEKYQIPVWIARKKEAEQWLIGEEAEQMAMEQEEAAVDCLFSRALNQEHVRLQGESYAAEDLLVLYLKKLIGYTGRLYGEKVLAGLTISVERLTMENVELLLRIREKLGLEQSQFHMIDRKSAFYYFILRQQESLWKQNVCLYDYRGNQMTCLRLERKVGTKPQLIQIEEGVAEMNADRKDECFYQVLQVHMKGYAVSSVYLIGNGFDGDWLNVSLNYLCRGRRAFLGKNLYAKGACYEAYITGEEIPWEYAYLGENEIKVNVSLKVKSHGKEGFFSLLDAGKRWYEAEGSCEMILEEGNEIDIWLQLPDNQQAWAETLVLNHLPERERKTTRLYLYAKADSDRQIRIRITDLGFGEIVKSSGMSWEYLLTV